MEIVEVDNIPENLAEKNTELTDSTKSFIR